MATAALRNGSALPLSARTGGAESICLQRRRIVRLAKRHEADAELARGHEFFLDLLDGSNADLGRFAPPRRARSGSAFSAARAPPKLVTRARNVRGPTFSDRTSLSQSKRC